MFGQLFTAGHTPHILRMYEVIFSPNVYHIIYTEVSYSILHYILCFMRIESIPFSLHFCLFNIILPRCTK